MAIWRCAAWAVCLASGVWGQAPSFEVASVKPNPAGQGASTRMGATATGYTYIAVPLQWIVAEAYNVPFYRVQGPEWIGKACYDVIAKAAAGSPGDQKKAMLQALLAQRFHLAAHRETKNVEGLEMTVGKGGPKMRTSDQPAGGYRITQDGSVRHLKVFTSTKGLAPMLAGMLGPVVDHTELSGVYEIAIDWDVSQPSERDDNLIRAVQSQLGLKLEQKKMPMEVVVVDRADRTPVEN